MMQMTDTDRVGLYRRYANELDAMIDHLAEMKELLVAAKLQGGLDELRARMVLHSEALQR
jgi:hypothetical protein